MNVAWQSEISIYRKSGVNIYGDAKYEFIQRAQVGVVRFVESIDKTSVRADSSASRGKAEQAEFDAVFIAPLDVSIKMEDVLIMDGKKMRVDYIHRRWGLRGRAGHYEIGANIWA